LLTTSLNLPPDLHPDELLREGHPAREIVAAARQWKADLIVIGSSYHGALDRLIGADIVGIVAQQAPCPILTVRADPTTVRVVAGGWRRMLRWARLKDEPGCPTNISA
jgi:hypothetical protein